MTSVNKIIENINELSYPIYYYNNPIHVQFIRHLIKLGANTALAKFTNKHILYAFIIPTKTNHNQVIIKFGYTEDIFKRIKTLQSEYKSNVYFINAKIISDRSDENKFHDMIKKKYESFVETYSIDNKKKIKLYKFSPILLKEFNDYLGQNNSNDMISEYINLILSLDNNIFGQKHLYDYLMTKEKNHHEQIIKQYDDSIRKTGLEISKLKYKYIDKEIQLVNAQTELASITKSNNIDASFLSNSKYNSKFLNTKK